MTTLERLQAWYLMQCDGDWEHESGVTIGTLDNPGWSIDIDVGGTTAAGRAFAPAKVERSPHDWLHATLSGNVVKIRCGPTNLEEALTLFLDWAGVPATTKPRGDDERGDTT